MTPDDRAPPAATPGDPADDASDTAVMARYGIVRRPVDYFHVGPYRYTNLDDAVAAAKRGDGKV